MTCPNFFNWLNTERCFRKCRLLRNVHLRHFRQRSPIDDKAIKTAGSARKAKFVPLEWPPHQTSPASLSYRSAVDQRGRTIWHQLDEISCCVLIQNFSADRIRIDLFPLQRNVSVQPLPHQPVKFRSGLDMTHFRRICFWRRAPRWCAELPMAHKKNLSLQKILIYVVY